MDFTGFFEKHAFSKITGIYKIINNNKIMINTLKDTIMFRSFKKEALVNLDKMITFVQLKNGEVLFHQGQSFE